MKTTEINKILKRHQLKSGGHKSLEQGACVMEMVSYLAKEPWSDHPTCACPVLSAFARRYNDRVDDKQRQKLKKLIPKLLNSKDPAKQKKRYEFFAHQSITVFLPILTEALGLEDITKELRTFKSGDWIAAKEYINTVKPLIKEAARKKPYAADAAYAAAAAAAAADAADAAYAAADAAYAAAADAAYAAAADAADAAADAADAAYAAAAAADAADAAYAAAAADAADAAADAADAAYAAYAAAAYAAYADKNQKFWLKIKQKLWDAGLEALKQACEL